MEHNIPLSANVVATIDQPSIIDIDLPLFTLNNNDAVADKFYNAKTRKTVIQSILQKLCICSNTSNAVRLLHKAYNRYDRPVVISFINAHGFNLCFKERSFYKALMTSDILFRDGKGMEILYKSAKLDAGVNMCGTDTIPLILDSFQDKSIALLGTAEPFLSNAVDKLTSEGKKVVLYKTGFFPLNLYVDFIKESHPDIIILGMGMPKQEALSILLKEELDYPCLIINGGAIIDHYGGKVSRAPKWMRKRGFEWLYRLIKEPKRLFRRYVIGNILFLLKVYEATGTIDL